MLDYMCDQLVTKKRTCHVHLLLRLLSHWSNILGTCNASPCICILEVDRWPEMPAKLVAVNFVK